MKFSDSNNGYARASTREQSLSRQLDAFECWELRPEQIIADMASGKDFDCPQHRRPMRRLRHDDALVIKPIDRLVCNYEEVIIRP